MTTAANTGSSLSKAQHLWTQYTTSTAADDTHAVIHPSLALRATPEAGVGIAATAPINAGETLLIIPPALQITPRTSAIHSHLPTDDPWNALVLCLLYELTRGQSSPHYHHLASLPSQYDLPLFWTTKQLKFLRGCSLPQLLDIETDWQAKIAPFVASHKELFPVDVDFSMYQQCVAVILSRGFRDYGGEPVLAPLIDYCNTAPSTTDKLNCHIAWHTGTRSLHLLSSTGIDAGGELLLEYGIERGTAAYLQRYGFVIGGNDEDVSELDVESIAQIALEMGCSLTNTPSTKTKKRKLDHSDSANVSDGVDDDDDDESDDEIDAVESFIESLPEEKIPLRSAGPLPLRLLKLCAALCGHYDTQQLVEHTDRIGSALALPLTLSDNESDSVSVSSNKESPVTSAPLSLTPVAELQVLQMCWMAMQEKLAELTLGHLQSNSDSDDDENGDNDTVDTDDDSRRRAMADVLRSSEKSILQSNIARVSQRMEELTPLAKSRTRSKSTKRNPVSLTR